MLIKEYSDCTKEKWSDVWDINVCEFFNIIAFSKNYNLQQKELMAKINNGRGITY